MKKIFSVLLVVIMLFSVFSVTASADVGDNSYRESENNNDFYYADVLYDDYTVSASVSGYDVDVYTFYLSQRSTVSLVCVADYNVLMMGLFDSSEEILKGYKTSYSNGAYSLSMLVTLPAGRYYVVFLNDDYYSSSNGYMFYYTYTSTSHTHSYSSEVTKPTCQSQGYTTYTCNCGYSYVGNYTAKTSHPMGIWVNTEDATCGISGEKVRYCSTLGCDYYETQTIPATGNHNMSEWTTIPATCIENGERYRYCRDCDYIESTIIPAGHDFENVTVPATCTKDGQIVKTCRECGHVETQILLGGHKYTNEVDLDCNTCGETREIKGALIFTEENGAKYYYYDGVKSTATGIVEYEGKKIYINKGRFLGSTGLVTIGGKKLYINKGYFLGKSGLVTINGKKAYVNKGYFTGASGLVTINGKKMYINKGYFLGKSGLVTIGSKKAYINKGYFLGKTGIVKIGSKRYYIKKGYAQLKFSGKVKISGKTYKIKKGIVK